MAKRRKVGRPEGADSDTTRRQILDAARACFSAQGYGVTTTRMIADAAGLTTATVYHHFGRKQDVMIAVHEDVAARSRARFRERVAGVTTAREMVGAVLDVIIDRMDEEPGVAVFEFTAFEESRRHPELAEIADDPMFLEVLDDLVRLGIATGEIDPAGAENVKQVLFSLAFGFAGVASGLSLAGARELAEGWQRLIAGQLLMAASEPVH